MALSFIASLVVVTQLLDGSRATQDHGGQLSELHAIAPNDQARAVMTRWADGDPVIVVDPARIELGEVPPDSMCTTKFRVINVSPRPVTVRRIGWRSGSFSYSNWDPIPPGHYATTEIVWRTSSSDGVDIRKKWTVHLADDEPVMFEVNGRTAKEFELDPPRCIRPTLRQIRDHQPRGELRLRSTNNARFRVTQVEPPELAIASDEAEREQVIQITWSGWSWERNPKLLNVHVDRPRPRRIPVLISPLKDAVKDGLVRFDPSELNVGEVPRGVVVLHQVTMTNSSTAPLQITSIKPDGPAVIPTHRTDPIAPGASIVVTVPITPENEESGDFERAFKLIIDDEVPARIVLRARVAPRPTTVEQ